MAFQAEQIDLAALEQSWIGRTVGHMTGNTALSFHGRMLKCERTLLVGMAVVTNHILGRSGPQLPGLESSVGVVAISAFHQSFVHSMVKWL